MAKKKPAHPSLLSYENHSPQPLPLPSEICDPSLSSKGINRLLSNHELLAILRDLCETGASIGTMEAKLSLNRGQLGKWLALGEQKPKSPYRQLLKMFRSWVATARATAEANQLVKAPSQWLERNSASRKLDTEETAAPTAIANLPAHQQLQLGAQAAIAAVEALVASGISIDEAARKGQIKIAIPNLPSPD